MLLSEACQKCSQDRSSTGIGELEVWKCLLCAQMTDLCSNTTWKGLHSPILVVMVSWQEDLVGLTSPVAVDDARGLRAGGALTGDQFL